MYRKSLKIFLAGTGAAVLLRALLKVLFVDLETGFYLGGAPLAWAFAAVLILSGAGLLWFGWREQDESSAFLKGNRWLECTAALLGAVLLADSVSGLLRVLAISPDARLINQMPRLLQLLEHLLGIASGGVFLCLAIVLLSGAARSGIQGMLALIPVLWQTLNMVDRFFGFRQVSTASDQTLEVLFLVSATLFLLAHTRCVANIPLSRRACVTRGFLTALFGFPLAAGQLAAAAVLGDAGMGPALPRLAVISAVSLYAAACSLSLVLSAGRDGESR
ncbi:hypothetical protein [Yanshouia hominis]|uniref:Uncharacterized protein n=1 Tax=Yanshouia hominis TaxID=2763673 RepID=A0ABR7NH51_9FIRM|nr:hypothetical protein [Yanshouia hominis]MBC8575739.1 hypothetical protein [Yanshouia hominis]